jgi:protoporphyrinogen oxidase
VIFHRLSKLDFLGENYGRPGTATYMMEYTYLDDDPVSAQSDDAMEGLFADGLKKIGFIDSHEEILSFTLKRFPYAYVVYDLKHKENMTAIRKFFKERNVFLNGRFGDFEYLNMDAVVAGSRMCAARIRDSLSGE